MVIISNYNAKSDSKGDQPNRGGRLTLACDPLSCWISHWLLIRQTRIARIPVVELKPLGAEERKRIMRINTCKPVNAALLLVLLLLGATPLQAQFNDWVDPGAGKWEVATNWSRGTPPSTNDAYNNIFTGTTITIDATTSGNFSNTMTANYVAIDSPTQLILELNNAGTTVPLHLLEGLDLAGENNSEVIITNSALQVDGLLSVGNDSGEAASFELDSGWAQIGAISIGNSGGYGFLNLNGGTLTNLGCMTLGLSLTGGGSVQMFGGTLINTNYPVYLGSAGYGGFAMYGGSVQAQGFQIGNAAGSQGQLFVEGGTALVSSNVLVGNDQVTDPCSVLVSSNSYYGSSGTLIVTNAAGTAYIDVAQNGSLTLNGGILVVDNLILTNGGTFTNLAGTFELVPPLEIDNGGSVVLAGSTNNFDSGVQLGSTNGGTGSLTLQSNSVLNVNSNIVIVSSSLTVTSTVSLTGGSLIMSNGIVQVGPEGSGQFLVTGGSHIIRQIWMGSSNGLGSGFFHMSGGTLKILGNGTGPGQGLVSNWVLWDGGDLDGSGTSFTVGDTHSSQAFLTGNGIASFADGYVGYSPGFTGTYDQTNGVMYVSDALMIGTSDCANSAVGTVNLFGGTLYVTNATHTAVLEVLNGTLTMYAGATLVVDNLILTNSCGNFIQAGGSLITNNAPVLDPTLSTVGDGIPNGWKQQYGFNPFDPTVARADPDHDGQDNLNEYLCGTDPLNSKSVLKMTGAVVTNKTDVSVGWTTVGGHSYVLQTNGNPGGRAFQDSGVAIAVPPGTGEGTTNYVQTNGAVNGIQFYRVRLGP
jgi:hypothetical protein